MRKYQMTYKGVRKYYLRCKLYGLNKSSCTPHSVRLDILEDEITGHLHDYITRYYKVRSAEEYLGNSRYFQKRDAFQSELRNLHSQLNRASAAFSDLYADKAAGELTIEQFRILNPKFQADISFCENRISVIETRLEELEKEKLDTDAIQKKIDDWMGFQELSRELGLDFIDYIEIGEKDPVTKKQEVRIVWLF